MIIACGVHLKSFGFAVSKISAFDCIKCKSRGFVLVACLVFRILRTDSVKKAPQRKLITKIFLGS